MNKSKKITLSIFVIFFFGITLVCWFMPKSTYSESERRLLAEKPKISWETVFSGEYMSSFEEYLVDTFPFRDKFRTVKALFSTKLLGKMENNNIYTAQGHISKIEYPENPMMIEHGINKFSYIYDTFLKGTDTKVYLSLVPDKNYFLARSGGYLSIDYDAFVNKIKAGLPFARYIDIFPLLTVDDYYKTDSHWKQEEIVDVAEYIGSRMGKDVTANYTVNTLDIPFKGVYLGQSALLFKPDEIKYLTNNTLKDCIVSYYDTGIPKQGEIYNMEKAKGKDPYEMYLSGTSPLITIENKTANTDKELILFRDSFGSSIAPLFLEGYQKITVVDIRYIQSSMLGQFIEFNNQDVLFLYSTTLLNNSTALR